MSWHVYKELLSDKVAESRICGMKTKVLKKNTIQVYLLLNNKNVAFWWTGRKYLALSYLNTKKFCNYENMGPVPKPQTRFALTSNLFWYNLLRLCNLCVPTSDQWIKCKRKRVLLSVLVRVSGYRYRGLGFDSRRYQIFWVVVGLERGPLSLVRSIEELLE